MESNCFRCGKGPLNSGVPVFRLNLGELPAVWACEEHIPEKAQVDPETVELVNTIQWNGNRQL